MKTIKNKNNCSGGTSNDINDKNSLEKKYLINKNLNDKLELNKNNRILINNIKLNNNILIKNHKNNSKKEILIK